MAEQALLRDLEQDFGAGRDDVWLENYRRFSRLARRHPEAVWPVVARWARSRVARVRQTAGEMLGELLAKHFELLVGRAEKLAARDPAFRRPLHEALESAWTVDRHQRIQATKSRFKAPRASGAPRPRTPPLEEILAEGNASFPDDLMRRIGLRKRRTAGERAAFRSLLVESYVPADGLAGFLSDLPVRDVLGTPDALRRIGAARSADVVSRALATLAIAPLPSGVRARRALIASLPAPARRRLDALGSRFPKEDVSALVHAFVRAHPADFPAPEGRRRARARLTG